MYIDENDVRTPRERVDDELLRRMAHGQSRAATVGARPMKGGCSCPIQPRVQDRYDCRGSLRDGGNIWQKHDLPLAMVYSPYQHWRDVYDCEKGLSRGTIFRDLDKPFEASQSKGGCC